eukprot:14780551-Ditylum_brightwellii.AAC.3
MAQTMTSYYYNKGEELGDELDFWQHGNLSGDSFTIKDSIVSEFHSRQMKGFVDEKWNHIDAIAAVLSSLLKNDSNEEDKPETAHHHFVIFFSAWAGMEHPFTFIAVQFATKNLVSIYLYDRYMEMMAALSAYGFVTTTFSGDGALENRIFFISFATVNVRDSIELGVFSDGWLFDPLIPLDLPIAFWHPAYEKGKILVFIQADMPHCIKKIVNAFYRSGQEWTKTDLKFCNKPLSLNMIIRLWIASDGGDVSYSTSLHLTKLTEVHFTKDGYSRMRCFLVMQVMSQTVAWFIDTYADECGGVKEYAPLCAVVKKVDILVDIMNSRVEKGYERIDSPTHRHLEELLSIVHIFQSGVVKQRIMCNWTS